MGLISRVCVLLCLGWLVVGRYIGIVGRYIIDRQDGIGKPAH